MGFTIKKSKIKINRKNYGLLLNVIHNIEDGYILTINPSLVIENNKLNINLVYL